MAVDKLVDSAQLDADLTSVADAIRAKVGTSASLAFPADFVTAIGNIPSGGGTTTLKMGVIRPDATLVQSYSYDKWLIADEVLESLPSYTTSATTLVASAALSTTVTLDYANYNYYVLQRYLTYPSYSLSSKAKGRVEYHVSSRMYEITEIPANTFIAFLNGTTKYTSRSVTVSDTGVLHRLVYWKDASSITPYSTSSYGTYQAVVAPTINSGALTINSPTVGVRGHTTYFTSTYFNAMTDIRVQYVIEVYRASKGNMNLDGWGHITHMAHIMDCANATNHKLT